MFRLLTIAFVGVMLSASACSSDEKKTDDGPTTTQPTMSDAEALIGSWSDGSNRIVFNSNNTYRWEQSRACGAPPCPTTATNGTYMLRNGKIYLDPNDGDDEVIEFAIAWDPRRVTLTSNKRSQTWNLNYTN